MFKLIAVDMDGTLLRSDHTVSEYTKSILRKASDKGAIIVITTGRPIQGVESYAKDLDIFNDDDFIICNNGSAIYSTKDYTATSANYLPIDFCKEIFKLGMSLDIPVEAFTTDISLNSVYDNYFRNEKMQVIEMPVKVINHIDDLNDFPNIFKVMFVDEGSKITEAISKIPQKFFDEYYLVRSLPQVFEFLSKESSKGLALAKLCDLLNIDTKDVVAFGDAANDFDMITIAGVGVAMGNAIDEVKELADFITDSNDKDGIAKFLEKYL